jgi:hypothetical protein
MPRDIEELLRQTLETRAADVQPDPATWTKVTRRIRRRQTLRWSLAGAGAVAAIALAAVALPAILSDTQVDLTPAAPGGPAPAPADPAPAWSGEAGWSVATDGEALYVIDAEGGSVTGPAAAEPGTAPITRLAVSPRSTPDAITVLYGRGDGCLRSIGWVRLGSGGGEVTAQGNLPLSGDATCMSAPVWSPDARSVAWVQQASDGTAVLQTLGWDEGPGTGDPATDNASFALDLVEVEADWEEGARPERPSVILTDWIWTEGMGTSTAGALHLAVGDQYGLTRAYTLPIERQGDGALALPANAVAAPGGDEDGDVYTALRVDAHINDGASEGPEYLLNVYSTGDAAIGRSGPDATGDYGYTEMGAPEEIVDGGRLREGVWLQARGDRALVGLGNLVWFYDWYDQGFSQTTRLDWLAHASLLPAASGSAPAPPPEVEPQPEADPDPVTGEDAGDPAPDPAAGPPAATEQTRLAILAAARAGDWDALERLVPDERFSYTFDDDQDPTQAVAYWRDLAEDGHVPVLDILAMLLEMPHSTLEMDDGRTRYAWPAQFDIPPSDWTETDVEQLRAIADDDAIEMWRQAGGYLGWRAAIDSTGHWMFFIAGD